MPNLGMSELIVILMILVLVFGASRLPQLGESMGRTIRSFKRGLSNDEAIEVKPPGSDDKAPVAKRAAEIADAEVVEKKS
jgi:sec-independent protein translocase protein TatA